MSAPPCDPVLPINLLATHVGMMEASKAYTDQSPTVRQAVVSLGWSSRSSALKDCDIIIYVKTVRTCIARRCVRRCINR